MTARVRQKVEARASLWKRPLMHTLLDLVVVRRALLCGVGAAAAVAVVVAVSSCVTTPTTPVPTPLARDFQALAVGNAWTYRATPGPDEPRVLRIVGFEKGYFVDDRGGRLAPRTDGLFDGSRFLLQDPIVVGHEWIAKALDQSLERYTIDATDVTVTVPAGTFTGCVQVTGRQQVVDPASKKPATLSITSTWAPKIGVVRVAFSVQAADAPPVTTSLTELVVFSPAGPTAP
jgi:hypothetical protein